MSNEGLSALLVSVWEGEAALLSGVGVVQAGL